MGQVGIDIDTGHQTALKPKLLGHCVVVDLVIGVFRGVIGFKLMGGDSVHSSSISHLVHLENDNRPARRLRRCLVIHAQEGCGEEM